MKKMKGNGKREIKNVKLNLSSSLSFVSNLPECRLCSEEWIEKFIVVLVRWMEKLSKKLDS